MHNLDLFADVLVAAEWSVREIPVAVGKRLIQDHHYAKGCSNTAVYMHGLFDQSGTLTGVVQWLPPTRVACESVNHPQWQRVLSLSRMVVLPGAPKNAASFLLARSIRKIKRDRRFVSLVTFADESQGHSGHVYRAANWQYVGRTGPYPRWLGPEDRQVSVKATKSRTKAQMQALGYRQVGVFYKHKFVMHLPGTLPNFDLF